MREIKFRAWDGGKMYTPFVVLDSDNFEMVEKPVKTPIQLMQFTGLYSKSGQPIYEGDIVRHGFHKEDFNVVWNEKSASFIAKYLEGKGRYSGGQTDKLLAVDAQWYEIIGNIYENPELLTNPSRE